MSTLEGSMEREKINRCSGDPLQAASPSIATVLVFEPSRARTAWIGSRISQCGVSCQVVETVSDHRIVSCQPPVAVALVALESTLSPQATCLNVVRGFKERGLKVIAYGDGIQSLPLRVRCLPLIAGAIDVLDSAASGFESALESILNATLRREATARAEEQGVQRAMKDLGIVAESAEMLSILRTILRISRFSDLPVLLSGETGTGKEKLARAIHRLDPKRRERPFVAVNCGAISPALAESELFGHRRGAFTGAERNRKGLIRAADGGVLFFDEIGELEAGLQAKLLRVLQEGRVLGVGEDDGGRGRYASARSHQSRLGADDGNGKFPRGPSTQTQRLPDPHSTASGKVGGLEAAGRAFRTEAWLPLPRRDTCRGRRVHRRPGRDHSIRQRTRTGESRVSGARKKPRVSAVEPPRPFTGSVDRALQGREGGAEHQ